MHLLCRIASFLESVNGNSGFLHGTLECLVGEVAYNADRELGIGFGLNPHSGSMFWAVRGRSRVESHVKSYSIAIQGVRRVPKVPVCLAYDFMLVVGYTKGLLELVSYFFDFLMNFPLPGFGGWEKSAKPLARAGTRGPLQP